MRTSVVLPDHLLVAAKKAAAERRVPFTRLLEESLRAYLAQEHARRPIAAAPLPLVREARPVRGADLSDTSRLLDLE